MQNKKKLLIITLVILLVLSGAPVYAMEGDTVLEPKTRVTALAYDRMLPFTNVTQRVAIIDTGISWEHPALSDIDVIYWRNMFDESNDVVDKHGHGTQIVGLLASNGRSGALKGLLPNAKYIILKGLNDNGETEDYVLARSIYRAVDYGARIIVLSLGISVNSDILKDAVDYAYDNDVLIVAAAGNNTRQVQYPAAYPTVLSVGSVADNGVRSSFTPAGYELNVLAQGEQVNVLKLRSGTRYANGTSMATPMVAAFAARLIQESPTATIEEVMSYILFSSKNAHNWNTQLAYGEVDYDQLSGIGINKLLQDQTNTTPARAINLSRSGVFSSRLTNSNQYRWYRIDPGHEGSITLTYRNRVNRSLRLDVFDQNMRLLNSSWLASDGQKTTFRVSREACYLRVGSDRANTPMTASFILDYGIGADIWEPNNTPDRAVELPLQANISATLHTANDYDWFYVNVQEQGDLRILATGIPEHMDPILVIQKGGTRHTVDYNAAGYSESFYSSRELGTFYFGIRDYNGNVINYPYTVDVSFRLLNAAKYTDITYHWAESDIRYLYQEGILTDFSGTRFHPNQAITRAEFISMIVTQMKLAIPKSNSRAFSDVPVNHWAHQAISTAKQYKLLNGYPDQTFRPNERISRAEIAILMYNAYQSQLPKTAYNTFSDVPSNYWANQAISSLTRGQILQGYPNGYFYPNNSITRAEAAAMIARIMKK